MRVAERRLIPIRAGFVALVLVEIKLVPKEVGALQTKG